MLKEQTVRLPFSLGWYSSLRSPFQVQSAPSSSGKHAPVADTTGALRSIDFRNVESVLRLKIDEYSELFRVCQRGASEKQRRSNPPSTLLRRNPERCGTFPHFRKDHCVQCTFRSY